MRTNPKVPTWQILNFAYDLKAHFCLLLPVVCGKQLGTIRRQKNWDIEKYGKLKNWKNGKIKEKMKMENMEHGNMGNGKIVSPPGGGPFYPLSDGPSIQNHRITMTSFRSCSSCHSRSQAPLCHYTKRAISDRSYGTFVLLRYSLGGDRPSQTTHHTLSSIPI